MADPASRFEVFAVGTVTVVTFGLVGVLLGHASGALSNVLPGLGTLPGVAVFGYLWVLAVLASRWTLAEGGLATAADGYGHLVARGAAAGAVAGMAFLLGPILVVGGYNLATAPVTGSLTDALSFLVVVLVVLAVAGVVGLALGALLALLNAGLYGAAGWLVGREQSKSERDRNRAPPSADAGDGDT